MPRTHGKGWVDKVVVADGKTIKLKRLQPVGNSFALFLPKLWIEFMCKADKDGRYWVEVEIEANKIIMVGVKELQ